MDEVTPSAVAKTIKLAVGTSTPGVYTTTSSGAGAWSIAGLPAAFLGQRFLAWVAGDSAFRASTFTKASSTANNISKIDLYQSRLVVKHEGFTGTSTTNTDLAFYDATNDADIQFDAVAGGALNVSKGQELHISPGSEYAPGGTVTLHGNAGTTNPDGDLHLATGLRQDGVASTSILTMGANELTLAGNWFASSTSIFTQGTSIYVIPSSTSTQQKIIIATSSPFSFLRFGSESNKGSWTFGSYAATTTGQFALNFSGITVTAPSTNLTVGSSLSSNGTFSHNSGTVIFNVAGAITSSMIGANAFNNLIFRGSGIKNFGTNSASTTNFTIESTSGIVTFPSTLLSISGNYTNNATVSSAGGTVFFDSASAQSLSGTMTGTSAFADTTFLSGTKTFSNNASTTANFTINAGSTVVAPSLLYVGTYTNNGTFTHNNGTVFTGRGTTLSGTMTNTSSFNHITTTATDSWTTSYDTPQSEINSLTLDSTNGVLYAGTGNFGIIYRCLTSTLCDAAADWTTSYDTPESSIYSLTFDSTNGVIYAGTFLNGIIYSCATSTLCDSAADWTTSYDTPETQIYSLTLDSTNGVLYAGTYPSGIIYRCLTSTLCDEAGDWTTSYDTPESRIFSLTLDSTNGVLYAGTGDSNGIIYRCATSTACDISTDWTISYNTTESYIYSLTFDTTNNVLYAGTNTSGIIYRCATSTLCDAAGDWTTSSDTPEANIQSLTFDSTNNVLYAGTGTGGIIYRASSQNIFSANASTTGAFTINSGVTVTAPTLLSIGGNYTNNGIFTHNSGTVTLNGSTPQTLGGAMIGTSAFNNLTILNNSGTDAQTDPGIIFGTSASTTGTFTATVANTKLRFNAGSTFTFTNLLLTGTSGSEVKLRSSSAGTAWNLINTGTQSVNYVDTKDSNACSGSTISSLNGIDSGGNTCWSFLANKIFSGTLFGMDETTAITTGRTIKLAIGTTTPGVYTTTSDGSGNWSINAILAPFLGERFLAWVAGDSAFHASTFTKASSTANNIPKIDLYQNRLVVKHEGFTGTSTTNTDLAFYDATNDADIQFDSVAGGALNVSKSTELHISAGSEYAPGGAVTLHGNAGTTNPDGDLHLATGLRQDGVASTSILTMGANELTLAGNWFASSTSIFTHSGTTVFNSSSTQQKNIIATSSPFYYINFTSDGIGGWTFGSNAATTTNNIQILSGTPVTAPSTSLTIGGSFTNNSWPTKNFIHNSGTVIFNGVGSQNINNSTSGSNTFNNLIFRGAGTKSFSSFTASTTNFTIESTSGAVTFPSTLLSISGNYTNNATIAHNNGTVFFNSTSAQSLSGTMIGSSAFASTTFIGSGTKTFNANASTSVFTAQSGSGLVVISNRTISISGNYTANATVADNLSTVVYFDGASQTLSASGAFPKPIPDEGTVHFIGSGTKTIANNASTTNFIIGPGVTVVAPSLLSITGNYTNNGIFTHNSGTAYLSGNSQQTLSGTMIGTSAFNNLTILNNSGTDAQTDPSVIFGASASTTGTFTATVANTKLRFNAGSTFTLTNLLLTGTSGSEVKLRSSSAGTAWNLINTGTQSVNYVDTKDSNACSGSTISSLNGIDSGGNTCWSFLANKIFSGTLFGMDKTTAITTGRTIKLAIGTTTPGVYTTTTDGSGNWSITATVAPFLGERFLAWVAGDSAFHASTFTKASSTANNISKIDLYQNRLVVKHEGFTGTSTTNTDLAFYDATNDADIQFDSVAGGALNVSKGQELHISAGSEYAPGGTVTLHGNAGTTNPDGDLHLATGLRQDGTASTSILSMGSNNFTLAGNWFASSTSVYNSTCGSNGCTNFNSTSTQTKSIIATSTPLIGFLVNSSGSWTFGSFAATTTSLLDIISGTLTLPSSTFTFTGSSINLGFGVTINNNSGTVIFAGTSAQNLAGSSGTFIDYRALNNLIFRGAGTKTFGANSASTTNFTVESTSGTVTFPSTLLSISGNYTNNATINANGGTVYASSTQILPSYASVSFDTAASGNANPSGITYANGFFWVTDTTDDEVYQYTTSGTYTGTSFDTAGSGNAYPSGITYANGFFWITDDGDDEVYQYTTSGTYTGTSFDTAGSGNAAPFGITYANGFFWILDGIDAEVYKYTSSGTYTGTSFDTAASGNDIPVDITYANGFFWVTDYTDAEVYKYTSSGAYTNTSFDTAASGNAVPLSITYANGFFWIVDEIDDEVYKYTAASQFFAGSMTGASAFNNLTFLENGAKAFATNASTTGNFTIGTGSGDVIAPAQFLTIGGNYTNNSIFNHNWGTTYFSSTTNQTLAGTMTGESEFASTTFIGSGTKTFSNNASTSVFTIVSGSGAVTAPSVLSIAGNYTNSGTFTHNSGLVYLNGSTPQTLLGAMIGTSAFNNLTILNNSGTDAQTDPGIIFGASASTTGTFTAITANTNLRFNAGSMFTFTNFLLTGTSGNEVKLRSSSAGTAWNLINTGTQSVNYVDTKDSNACSGSTISSLNGIDSGGNTCWSFLANKIFSGTLFGMDKTTAITTGRTIKLAIGTTTPGVYTTTTDGSGNWSITATLAPFLGQRFLAWVAGDSAFRSATFTKASSTVNNIPKIDLYQNRLVVKHEGFTGTSTTNTDLAFYDATNDADIQFDAVAGGALNVSKGQELHIAAGSTYAPGGVVTLHGNASTTNPDGDLHLATGVRQDGVATTSILSMGANTLTLAGNWFASSTSIFTHTGTATFNSTSTQQKNIVATSSNFSGLTFNGVAGSWTFGANSATTTVVLNISNGTLAAPSSTFTIASACGGACFTRSGSFIHNSGTVIFPNTSSLTLPSMIGANAFNNVIFRGAGTKSFTTNSASTTNFTVESTSGIVTFPSTLLSISGNYTNNGTIAHNSGLIYLNGSTPQTLVGTMIGTSAFNNLTVLNNSGTDAQTDPGIIFGASASTTGTFTAITPNTKLRFNAGSTFTFTNLLFTGTSGSEVKLRSSSAGTAWNLINTGTQSVNYVDTRDSNACSGNTITTSNSINSTGNSCWSFALAQVAQSSGGGPGGGGGALPGEESPSVPLAPGGTPSGGGGATPPGEESPSVPPASGGTPSGGGGGDLGYFNQKQFIGNFGVLTGMASVVFAETPLWGTVIEFLNSIIAGFWNLFD